VGNLLAEGGSGGLRVDYDLTRELILNAVVSHQETNTREQGAKLWFF
jgi:hypothetical protein